MSMAMKEGADTEGLPTIKLGSTEFFIAKPRLRNRIAMASLMGKVKAVSDRIAALGKDAVSSLEEADMMPIILVVRESLRPLYPDITTDDLLDSDAELDDFNEALGPIMQQATSRRAAKPGEAKATSKSQTSSTNSDGADSSPKSP